MSRIVGQCQIAIAEAVEAFGRVDVLLGCTNEGKNFPRTGSCQLSDRKVLVNS